jgi:TetR/AcrR family transcriptional regulator
MTEPEKRRGEATREAILLAAETVFAEHGFDGARVDTIAEVSGYNKTLIFRYYGDKLGLYTEVLRRADREMGELMAHVFAPLLEDEHVTSQTGQFRAFLKTMIQALFDYLLEHPRLVRILTWEMADGWQTFARIASQFPPESIERFELLFHKARQAVLLRSDFKPAIQFGFLLQVCQTYLTSLPMFQILLPTEDLSSPAALTSAREYIVNILVHGMMTATETTS